MNGHQPIDGIDNATITLANFISTLYSYFLQRQSECAATEWMRSYNVVDVTVAGLVKNFSDKKTKRLISRDPLAFKTVTADNATEFHQYKAIETHTPVKFYFANPYHSWERGGNENANGLIRQYIPKGASMENLAQQQCDRIADELNSRPRKRYQYRSPEELYYA